MSTRIWSPQQQAFLTWVRDAKGSCVLVAVAGAGKTTVLLEAISLLNNTIYVAYNKDVATETQGKLEAMNIGWKQGRAATVHSAGLGIIKKANPGFRVEEHKVRSLFDRIAPQILQPRMGEVLQLVSLAKQSAFGSAGPAIDDTHAWLEMAAHFDVFDNDTGNPTIQSDLIGLAQGLLIENNKDLGTIDFDDMVYLPVLHSLPCWQFDNLMLDEAQDTNAARRALARVLVHKGGRLMAVGDPCQAIYGFTGADSDALDLIQADFNAIRLPLTITYRCPKTVVKVAQQWVSHISAANEAPEGAVTQTTLDAFMGRNDLDGTSAVLCRNNKPLVALAFALLRQRTPCQIAGRDIGGSLKKLLGRWKITSLDALESKLDDYLARQTTRLLAKKQESRVAQVEDQVETCKVIIGACRAQKKYTVSDAIEWVNSMFTDPTDKNYNPNLLTLSSIHKSKGREWINVFWLDRAGTCPSKWARQAWQQEQEKNLMYVCATRAKAQLIDITVPEKETQREPG